jgi:LemA protein
MISTTAATAVATALLVVGIWIYNGLVKDRNQVRNAWSDIDVQLRRRHDLVPQLVNAVKAYADYEKATLTAVTELRARSEAVERVSEKATLEEAIETGIRKLVAVAEGYPELKADANFRQLQDSLLDVEDHLQYARRFYNGAVRMLNTRIESFPHLLLARPLRFIPAEFFQAATDERAAPTVELG